MALVTKSDPVLKMLAASAAASSDIFERSAFSQHTLQFIGVTAAACTCKIMVSLDGSTFTQMGSDVTADGIVVTPPAYIPYLRIDRSGGAGNITVFLGSGTPNRA